MGHWNAKFESLNCPGDFVTKVKQINNQSDLISMSNFAGPSYIIIKSSVCIILIWNPFIFILHSLCQTLSNPTRRKSHQCALHFNKQIIRTHFLLLQPSIRPVPAEAILLWKGLPKLCIECHLVPLWAFLPRSLGSVNLVIGKWSTTERRKIRTLWRRHGVLSLMASAR